MQNILNVLIKLTCLCFKTDMIKPVKRPQVNAAAARNALVSELATKFQHLQPGNAAPAESHQPDEPVKKVRQAVR